MSSETPRFDKAFLERKRRQLLAIREQLKQDADFGEIEEAAVKNESAAQAREYEDDAQKLDTLGNARKSCQPRYRPVGPRRAGVEQDRRGHVWVLRRERSTHTGPPIGSDARGDQYRTGTGGKRARRLNAEPRENAMRIGTGV